MRPYVRAFAAAAFGLTMTSWPGTTPALASVGAEPVMPANGSGHAPRTLALSDAPHITSFTIKAVNTGETVTVKMLGNRPTDESAAALAHLLRCNRTQKEHAVDSRLVLVLSHLAEATHSDLELVSGYRAPRNARDKNFHTQGMAADIRIPGVRTWDLRKLAADEHVPGLGYYPTSKMVHVDVRDVPYKWTDWSGPQPR
jgi:uncharacterized protein YcbK (DUF882 family)